MKNDEKLNKLNMQGFTNNSFNCFLISGRKDIKDRLNAFENELKCLKSKFSPISLFSENILRFYYRHPRIEVGNVSKTFDFITNILKCYGFNDDEINNFFLTNFKINFSNYDDFRARLAIFNHFGFLDEVLFKKHYLLTRELEENYKITTGKLYAIMEGVKFSSLDELKTIIKKMNLVEVKELQKMFPLKYSTFKAFDDELISSLIEKNMSNNNVLSK